MSLLAIMLYSTTRSSVLILLICSLVDAYVRLPFAATLPSQLRSAVISSDTAYTSSDVPMDIHWDWQQVASQAFEKKNDRPIILFDGQCNLCNGGVNFALDHDPNGTT
jgi:hypothetical protein